MPDLEAERTERQRLYREAMANVPEHQRQYAHRTAEAINACHLCDTSGYRSGTVCDHVDHAAAARRGMALVREALERKQ
jgi:hypothetical protein